MPTPFPGMDPFLEHANVWEDVHTRLLAAMAEALGALLRPPYQVEVAQRTYVVVMAPSKDEFVVAPEHLGRSRQLRQGTAITPRPAVLPRSEERTTPFVAIRDRDTGEVITVLELLSPTHKLTRDSRVQYERQRLQVLGGPAHFIEIDLLRAGEPLPFWVQDSTARSDYRILVSRVQERPRAEVYLFTIRDPIPVIPVPLRPGDIMPPLDVHHLLQVVYDRARYDRTVDYGQVPPSPQVSVQDLYWMKQLCRYTP